MRSNAERHSYHRGSVSIHLDDDVAQPHRLPKAGIETECTTERPSSTGRDGDHSKTCDCAAGFSRIASLFAGQSDCRAIRSNPGDAHVARDLLSLPSMATLQMVHLPSAPPEKMQRQAFRSVYLPAENLCARGRRDNHPTSGCGGDRAG